MNSLAREWGPDRIRINMILPGWHATALTQHHEEATAGPFARVLEHGTTMTQVADFVVAVATMPSVSGQVFNIDSRMLPC
jgi:NAD(P)-dependent dehydrogenase (short-subunit alcohol dehydrogenase family)